MSDKGSKKNFIEKWKLNMKMWGWKLAWLGFPEKNKTSYLLRLKGKTLVLRPALQSNHSSLCGLDRSKNRLKGGSDSQIVSVKKAADGKSLMKSTGPRTDFCGTSRRTQKERLL